MEGAGSLGRPCGGLGLVISRCVASRAMHAVSEFLPLSERRAARHSRLLRSVRLNDDAWSGGKKKRVPFAFLSVSGMNEWTVENGTGTQPPVKVSQFVSRPSVLAPSIPV